MQALYEQLKEISVICCYKKQAEVLALRKEIVEYVKVELITHSKNGVIT
jgi:hypothetical protein